MKKQKEMYAVFYSYDSEINILDAKDTYEEAFALMKEDFDRFNESVKSTDNHINENMAVSDGGISNHPCKWTIKKTPVVC